MDEANRGSERKWILDMDHGGMWCVRSLRVHAPPVDVGAVRVYARAGTHPSQTVAALRTLAAKIEEGLSREPKQPKPHPSPSTGTASRW